MADNVFFLLKFEMMIVFIIFLFLFIKVVDPGWRNETLLRLVNGILLVNLLAGFLAMPISVLNEPDHVLFSGMFHTGTLVMFEKNLLNLGLLIISLQSYDWLKNHRHLLEFYILLLSALLGMFCMISSGNMLMFYLGFELSTIPLAAVANFDLTKKQSSESAMKLIMSSAFSSAFLLFGISFLYGSTGSLNFEEIAGAVTGDSFQLFAFVLFLAGVLFKVSVVPFHLWTADVYQGAPVAVTAFLSVISKGAVFFVLVPVLYTLFKPLIESWYVMLVWLAVFTMIIGNLFALRQENMKRLLTFSSIAQVGFILVGILGSSRQGSAAVIYFVLIYIFSNLGAFGVVGLISSITGKENLSDYRGLYKTNPGLSWGIAIALFSLAGIPPTAGFFGKFFLLIAGAGKGNYLLITVAALNMVISLYYYLRVIRAIFMEPNEQPIGAIKISLFPKLAMVICIMGIVLTGLIGWVYEYIFSLTPVF